MSLVLINLCAIFHSYGTSLSIHVETVPTAVVLHAYDKEQQGDCIRTVLEQRVMGKEKATIRQGTSDMANNRSPICSEAMKPSPPVVPSTRYCEDFGRVLPRSGSKVYQLIHN